MESLIQRAAMILGAGLSEEKVAGLLIESGVSNEDAFLAVKAAVVLISKRGR